MLSEIEQERIYQKILQLQRELNSLSRVKQTQYNYPGKTERQIEYFTRNKKFQVRRTGQQLENFQAFNRKILSNQRLIEKLKNVIDYEYYVFKKKYQNQINQTRSTGLISQSFQLDVLKFGQWQEEEQPEIFGEHIAISLIGAQSYVTTLTNEPLVRNISKYIDEQTKLYLETFKQLLVQAKLTLHLIKKEDNNRIDRSQYTTTEPLKNQLETNDIIDLIQGLKNNDSSILVSQIRIEAVQYIPISNIDKRLTFQQLRAFNPSQTTKFHEITFKSTSNNKICIFETFVIIHDIFSAYNKKQIKEEFLKLDKQLQYLIKNGNVEKSIQGLQKYYQTNKEDFLVMYKIFGEIQAVQIEKDNFNIINYEDIKQNEMCFLYNNEHVAPYKYDKKHFIWQFDEKQKKKYSLKPTKCSGKSNKIKKYWSFDTETRKVNEQSVVFEIHLTDCDKGSKCDEYCLNKHLDFYGDNCINKFVEYIIENLIIKTKISKTGKKAQVEYHNIFGHNNARYDSLLIFSKILDYVGIYNQKSTIDGNTIKTLKFFNIKFFDMCQFYTCTLSRLAKFFKLEDTKMKYPYKFADLNFLYYKGDVPDLMFWNDESDREQYVKENGNQFDMEKYTKEYCKRDCQLTLQIAKLHLQRCKGEMNGKQFDVTEKQTAASLSLELFQQCFLKEWIQESPQNIEKLERKTYNGGRNEVFKKEFQLVQKIIKKFLYYIDINSSYPASMTKIMPFKFKKHYVLSNSIKITDQNQIVDYYMYECTYEYKGNDKYYIPNILQKDEKGRRILRKKSEGKIVVWGCELKEAFLSQCECEVFSQYEYEGRYIFKEYIEEIYKQRLNAKKEGNNVIVEFNKLLMNSLYGKMGQGLKTKTMIVNHINEFFSRTGNKIMLEQVLELGENRLLVKYKDEKDENKHIGKLVRFAAYITAESRTSLSRAMRFVGYENVYYCDTDSIFFECTQEKFDNEIAPQLCHQTELGKFKLEKIITEAYFCAPKVYAYISDGKDETENFVKDELYFKMKGIKEDDIIKQNKGKDVVNTEKKGDKEKIKQNYIDITQGKKIVYLNETMFKRSIIDGVKIIPQERTIQAVLNKREWNGNESYAF